VPALAEFAAEALDRRVLLVGDGAAADDTDAYKRD